MTKQSSKKPKRKRDRPLKRLASLADRCKIDNLEYYFGRASRAEPKILETEEIFYAVAAECEVIAYTILSPDDWCLVNQKQRINRYEPIIEKKFIEKYPQIHGRVRIIYKRSGGWNDPNGRYVPIFKGAKARYLSLDSVLKQSFRKDGIAVNRKSTTTLNGIAQEHFDIKKAREAAIAARNDMDSRAPERLHIIRFSSWEGFKKARKYKLHMITGRVMEVNGIPTLYVVQSARGRDITHNKSVRTALLEVNPDVVELADVDRLGREYWEAAYNSFGAMRIRVEFKDPDWVPDMHLRPATTKIDRQTEALNDVCVVHINDIDKSKVRKKYLLESLRRVRNHYLIKKEKLVLLGIHPRKLQQKVIGPFGNAFSEIVQIAIGSAQSFILIRPNHASLTNRRPPPSTRSPVTKCSPPLGHLAGSCGPLSRMRPSCRRRDLK